MNVDTFSENKEVYAGSDDAVAATIILMSPERVSESKNNENDSNDNDSSNNDNNSGSEVAIDNKSNILYENLDTQSPETEIEEPIFSNHSNLNLNQNDNINLQQPLSSSSPSHKIPLYSPANRFESDQRESPIRSTKNNTKSLRQTVSEGLWPSYCDPSYVMPNSIEVKVTLPAGDYYFPVNIVKFNGEKIYFGGYRNKNNGTIYHHASSQTPTDSTKTIKDTSGLRTRETQTTVTKTSGHQTIREAGTQMDREDVRISKKCDVVKIPKKYVTADQVIAEKMVKSVVIQRYWRGFLARRRADGVRQRNRERDQMIAKEKEENIQEQIRQRDENMRRRLQPKTNADFEILYNELDAWRRAEIAKIKLSDKTAEEKSESFALLLQEETDALQSIERLKMSAQRELQTSKNERMLEMMSQPRQWQLSSGDVAYVQTPETNRAKELLEMYRSLILPVTTVDNRLDVLLKIKWTVQVYDSDQLAMDIIELLDREADLLNRGRPFKSMEKLRIRIAHMFLEFIESPEYNPRAADFVNISITVKR